MPKDVSVLAWRVLPEPSGFDDLAAAKVQLSGQRVHAFDLLCSGFAEVTVTRACVRKSGAVKFQKPGLFDQFRSKFKEVVLTH